MAGKSQVLKNAQLLRFLRSFANLFAKNVLPGKPGIINRLVPLLSTFLFVILKG